MSGRGTTAILAGLAAAALLAAAAVLFLDGGGSPALPPPPPDPDPPPARVETRTPDPAPRATERKPPRVPPAAPEDDAPPVSERTSVPAGWKPWARLRFLDAGTREAIPFGRGRVALVLPRGDRDLLVPEPWRRAEDGRTEVFRSEDEKGLPHG